MSKCVNCGKKEAFEMTGKHSGLCRACKKEAIEIENEEYYERQQNELMKGMEEANKQM